MRRAIFRIIIIDITAMTNTLSRSMFIKHSGLISHAADMKARGQTLLS